MTMQLEKGMDAMHADARSWDPQYNCRNDGRTWASLSIARFAWIAVCHLYLHARLLLLPFPKHTLTPPAPKKYQLGKDQVNRVKWLTHPSMAWDYTQMRCRLFSSVSEPSNWHGCCWHRWLRRMKTSRPFYGLDSIALEHMFCRGNTWGQIIQESSLESAEYALYI